MKKIKFNPYLTKKELAELKEAEKTLLKLQSDLEKAKQQIEEQPIIFKKNNG